MDTSILNRKRGNIKGQITKLTAYEAEEAKKADEVEISSKLEIINKLEDKLEDLQLEYYKIVKDDELTEHEREFSELEDALHDIKVRFKRLLKSLPIINKSEKVIDNKDTKINVKLPEIPLPRFSGLYSEWLFFKSQFKMLIDENSQLNDQQKLYYLQSALTGNAKQIESLEDSYKSLFKALEERYENKRLIANSHINELLNFNKIKFESSKELQNLIDSLLKNLRALNQLDLKQNEFSELMLINIIVQKLDTETKKMYEISLTSTDLPKWDAFIELLQKRVQILENLQRSSLIQSKEKINVMKPKVFLMNEDKASLCKLCKKYYHPLYKCPTYQNMNVKQRFDFVKRNRHCTNCLNNKHLKSKCVSNSKCITCGMAHHSSLHFHQRTNDFVENSLNVNKINQTTHSNKDYSTSSVSNDYEINDKSLENCGARTNCLLSLERKTVLLSTAIIYVKDFYGKYLPFRCVLDSGSESCFATANCINILNLKRYPANVSVYSLHKNELKIKSKVQATIANNDASYEQVLELLVVPSISDVTPSTYLDTSNIFIPQGIVLADPGFFKPSKIDILIGAERFYELIDSQQIYLDNGRIILRNSVFGFIVSGSLNEVKSGNKLYCGLVREDDHTDDLNTIIKNFWELEDCNESNLIQGDAESFCEQHFSETHYRNETGRYVVKMPLRQGYENQLGHSKQSAIRNLNSLHKRLVSTPELLSLYIEFMREYEALGHMEEVEESNEADISYYIPHHSVYRPLAKTTKLRVVFNASAPTTTGFSLNSLLLNGGVLQEELFSILLRFRKYRFVFIADVEKMYRQILIHPDQRDLQKIVWKENMHDKLKVYKLKTVTYGTVSAPFLATRTLKQLALDEGSKYPEASPVVINDMYMDDVLSGEQDLEKAIELQNQLIAMFQTGGMKLYKWSSNSKPLLDNVPNDDRNYKFQDNETVKTLGLIWNPRSDSFQFTVSPSIETSSRCTKRTVLSDIAKLFDPLGLLGPIIVRAKIFIQQLWLLKIDWDETLPERESHAWHKFISCLHLIRDIKVNRYVLCDSVVQTEIHGFSDASKSAFGAVIYLRCVSTSGQISVNLLCSKSRVAPLKVISIPRLELSAALLLVKLSNKVTNALKLNITQIKLYSDSTIVLAWIRNEPHLLKTFVANRVSKIQQQSDPRQWYHINSKDNAADILSRGTEIHKLLLDNSWWTGPDFLKTIELPDPIIPSVSNVEAYSKELKPNTELKCFSLSVKDTNDTMNRMINCSNKFCTIIRVCCFVFRFINMCRKTVIKKNLVLDAADLLKSEMAIIKHLQQVFQKEIKDLKREGKVAVNSQVRSLHPYLDEYAILRVGGRLSNSNLPSTQKYPIILPANHRLTYLIIKEYHLKYMHLGPQSLLFQVRQKYWPINGRTICRKVVFDCVTCFKAKPRFCEQVMGNLPKERVNPDNPFNHTGVDFCGPFTIKYKYQRKGIYHKIYLAIFICLTTKAIHIEMVTDLTSQSFIAALKRFFSRRGKSSVIYSDNAKNFVGSKSELKRLFEMVRRPDESLGNYMSNESIEWKFVPPRAPNFGGLWEAGVKSIKYHLKRVVCNSILNYEEFLTIINQVEAILNSRPLIPLSSDVDDLNILTPGHFLIGRPINAILEPSLIDVVDNKLNSWQRVTKLTQAIWKKWSNDYLSHLQQRSKWQFDKQNVKTGDLVLIKDDQIAIGNWPRGIILEVFPGPDGKIRVVNLKTQTGIYKRAISKIALLPIDNI